MSAPPIALARWLVDAGAGVSARTVLGDLRGAPANQVRLRADRAALRPGVFALVALPDGRGLALPLAASPGRPRAKDEAFREACSAAHACVRDLLDATSLPSLRFELEEELAIFGSSIGLAAALAFLAHFMPSRAPDRAVLATGRLLGDGRVVDVGHRNAKAEIAAAERGARWCLLPAGAEIAGAADFIPVSTLAEAAARVLGPAPWRADPDLWAIDDLLRRARTAGDPLEGITLLDALPLEPLAAADRVRVLFDLGTLHRNRGDSRRARELHERARELLGPVRLVVGSDIAERYDLELAASALDDLEVDGTVAWLRRRLGEPFLRARNELRCRGMLAQGLSISGAFAEALAVREGNLALHERSAALARSLPMTLCQLAIDAAFAGEAAAFEQHVARLARVTLPGEDLQERWSAGAIVRGLVALGRGAEALAWAEDRRRFHSMRVPPTFVETARGEGPIASQPELTAARSLVRALRGAGEVDRAVRLAERALAAQDGLTSLFRWTAALVRLEQALTLLAGGRGDAAQNAFERAKQELMESHPRATLHHGLADVSLGPALEERLARIWF